MKKFYNEYFYVGKHEKIREKVMITRVVMMVSVVIACLLAMSITAYAYFSYNVSSSQNVIKSSNFETKVLVQVVDDNSTEVQTETSNNISHTADLKANTQYYVTIEQTELSNARTGFVILTAENCDIRYHTQQLGKDGDNNTEKITFCIEPTADTTVTFLSHWGTSKYYAYLDTDAQQVAQDIETNSNEKYILQNETVILPINGVVNSDPADEPNNDFVGEPNGMLPTDQQ